ncbi:MAG: hypothetical protein PHF84_12480, partial [bacterium]|nr:hypothetical protein [bacterium]
GFTAGSNWAGNARYSGGTKLYTWPYAKTGFVTYSADGQTVIARYGQDLDPDSDYDNILLNKFLATTNLADAPDGDVGNDWETMVPFYDDGLTGHEIDYGRGAGESGDGIYSANQSFMIKLGTGWNNGVYIVRGGIELTAVDAQVDIGDGGQRTVHFVPYWKGGYISSESAQSTFEVDIQGVNPVDSMPPHITAVSPENGSTVVYRLSSVSCSLEDDLNGSGVDLSASDIYLTYTNGNRVAGKKINNGTDVISWQFDTPLSYDGNYNIYVKPVDKRGNQPADYTKYTFTLDIEEDDYNMITVEKGGNVLDNKGRVCLRVPPYAVDQDMRVTLFTPFSFPGTFNVYGGIQFMPSVISFKRPVELILHYSETERAELASAGFLESDLRVYNWRTTSWEHLGGNVDSDSSLVSVSGVRKIDGYYGLLPESVGGLPGDIISDIQVDKPFRKNGYISFRVSGSISSLKLLIYDIAGNFIKEISNANGLISPVRNAGYYSLSWDLSTEVNQNTVNNGIYVFRFVAEKAGGETKTVSKAIPVIK